MKTIQFIVLLAASFFLLINCDGQTVKQQKLNPDGFESKLKSTPEKILVDVRSPKEYAEGHLDKAILIDIYSNDFTSQIQKLDKSKPVFVYCYSGTRSNKAANALVQAGFKQVYDLDGGILAWSDAGKKITK